MGGTKGGVHMRGQIGRQEERVLTAEGWGFPDCAVNNKMWSYARLALLLLQCVRNATDTPKYSDGIKDKSPEKQLS